MPLCVPDGYGSKELREKPWVGLQIKTVPEATQMFQASVRISVGTGDQVLFWEDPWISGQTVASLAPAVLVLVRPGVRRRRTVCEDRKSVV